MRKYIILSMAFLSFSASAVEQRQLFIPSRAAELLKHFDSNKISAVDGDMAVVQVADDQMEDWADFVHDRFGLCGGFFDVTGEIAEGKTARNILATFDKATIFKTHSAPVAVVRDERVVRLVNLVDHNHIKSFLTELTSFDDRSATTSNGTLAADFLAQRASDIGRNLTGFTVRKVATSTYPKQPSVVASYAGSKPNLPHVVIGGHMDTLSYAKPGADDDGSGSTMVMEALRTITNSGARFERTIDFMWYAAEERGLVGSSSVVKDYKANRINVAAAIQFDMTGWVNPIGIHDIYLTDDYTDRGLNQTLESIITVYLPGLTIGHAQCGYACSDHASWYAASVPAVYPFESAHDDYNRRIHTSSDKMDFLSINHMVKFAKIGVAFLGQMAVIQ